MDKKKPNLEEVVETEEFQESIEIDLPDGKSRKDKPYEEKEPQESQATKEPKEDSSKDEKPAKDATSDDTSLDDSSKEEPKMAKKSKKSKTAKKNMNVYTNLSYKRKAKKDAAARKRAEDLATLPKQPVKRFFARLHPKRVFKWWFSWRGQKTILKIIAVCLILGVIGIGGLFLYYKKDLDEIRLDEISISETVNTYLDRNGVVLWQDTGSEDYRLVIDGDDIPEYMRQATIAIEDRNFYSHIGVDPVGLVRAVISTVSGKQVQGGSTLTQQLIKQVYFADEAASANRGGLTRKIKELILAIELERMYSKDEILAMYLNQSPYGGRRNGIESAAQTYFGKSAKDLTLAECALLASIPNNPAIFNPYNEYGNEDLIWRQHYTLDVMAEMGFITEAEAEEAKAVAILDTIQPESSQYANALAPHFVLEVKGQLEDKYGIQTMRAGGWTITTTLDYRAQQIAEDAVATGMRYAYMNKSDNMGLVSVDVETAQVIAMVGSADFNNPIYGEQNVTTDSLIEPGSSIKPILDYTPLFMQRDGINYGPGSILRDENIDSIYCAGYTGGSCALRNSAGRGFYGNITIRYSLGYSLNIGAVKALYINGVDNSLEIAHALGDISYCAEPGNYGLSIAIGSGCGVKMVEHANAFASLARGGTYKELAYVLEIKNSAGDIIESWTDGPGTRVVDEQVAYMVTNILGDTSARYASGVGFVTPGVWTGIKTGTTTTSNANVTKDSLFESFSTAVSTFVWNGMHDGSGLSSLTSMPVQQAIGAFMERVHKEVYEPDGRWRPGDQPVKPAGIQTLTVNGKTDIWPSWFNADKNSGVAKETLTFNKYTHLLAAACTPENQKIEIEVTKVTDPMTGKETYSVPEPYDHETTDTCDYKAPTVTVHTNNTTAVAGTTITVVISKGSYDIQSFELYINGKLQPSARLSPSGLVTGYNFNGTESSIRVVVTDAAGYSASAETSITPSVSGGSSGNTGSSSSSSGASGSQR